MWNLREGLGEMAPDLEPGEQSLESRLCHFFKAQVTLGMEVRSPLDMFHCHRAGNLANVSIFKK